MNKKTLTLILLAALILIIGIAQIVYSHVGKDMEFGKIEEEEVVITEESSAEAEAEERELMPDFTVYDAEGNAYNLHDFFGKPIVINFWASWCGPCQNEMPYFNEKYEELGDEVQFLMVNLTDGSRETIARASSYVEKEGFSFPVFYDTDGNAQETYGVFTMPMSFFIDANGYGVTYAVGSVTMEELERGIDYIS